MKALTICQPYAHLIITGQKRVENRGWKTNHRGDLIIHAGKSREWLGYDTDADLLRTHGEQIPFGAAVGIVKLIDCLHIDMILNGTYDGLYPWLREHEHTHGEWCWVLSEEIIRFDVPVPCSGKQGLWVYEPRCKKTINMFSEAK